MPKMFDLKPGSVMIQLEIDCGMPRKAALQPLATGECNMFGLGGKNKDFKVTIKNTGQIFEVKGGINLLQAAKNAGIDWPCDCKVGSCGSCRAKLVSGKVKELTDFAYTLDGDMLKNNYILACQSRLKTDLEVEVDFDQGAINPDYKS